MMRRSVDWVDGEVHVVDQRALPQEYRIARLRSVDEIIEAIETLTVRGAPAIGAAGALAVALSAQRHGDDADAVRADAARVAEARPTAVNLAWAVRRVLARLPAGPQAVLADALALLDEDERVDRRLSARAADEVTALCRRTPLRVLTHCNTGRFATVGWGTALGAIRELAGRRALESVLAGETRPLLQGARLTAWELAEAGIPHRICVDSAGPAAVAAGAIDCVLVGADRITARGDVANKIGTYPLALAAARAGIPFVVVAPESTVDESLDDPSAIVIEERDPREVTLWHEMPIAPAGTDVYNPAFDVTPRDLVTAVVTESRTLRPASVHGLPAVAAELYGRGWLDGTAGNLSVRLGADRALITASGRSKGTLTAHELITVDLSTGGAIGAGAGRPSAETSIHAALYRLLPDCGAVVHAHPPSATTAATVLADRETVRFDDFEIVKGLDHRPGTPFTVPVLANHVDVARIAADLAARLSPDSPPAVLIDRHGATTWGPDLETARNRMECLEMLCQLQLRTGGGLS